MTELEWEQSTDPFALLAYLRERAGARPLRLFACACWRRCGEDLERLGKGTRLLVTVTDLERLADGLEPRRPLDEWATTLLAHDPWTAARQTAVAMLARGDEIGSARSLVRLLHDLVGNPFRPPPALDRAVLAWQGGAVRRLAEALYRDRHLADLPVLADLLEEAGCSDPALLAHLRGPGPHALGCWALDLIRGPA
jgi:hypothetical protein